MTRSVFIKAHVIQVYNISIKLSYKLCCYVVLPYREKKLLHLCILNETMIFSMIINRIFQLVFEQISKPS